MIVGVDYMREGGAYNTRASGNSLIMAALSSIGWVLDRETAVTFNIVSGRLLCMII